MSNVLKQNYGRRLKMILREESLTRTNIRVYIYIYIPFNTRKFIEYNRLCDLLVRVPGSIPGAARFSEK
jgi:hypothetical protein